MLKLEKLKCRVQSSISNYIDQIKEMVIFLEQEILKIKILQRQQCCKQYLSNELISNIKLFIFSRKNLDLKVINFNYLKVMKLSFSLIFINLMQYMITHLQ